LLASRLSREGGAAEGAAGAHVQAPGMGTAAHRHVTPLKQGTSGAKRAAAMRLDIAVPGNSQHEQSRGACALQCEGFNGTNEASEAHGGVAPERESMEDEVDMLTPLDSETYLMHKRVQEVMRKVGPALNKETARRLVLRAQGDVRVAVAIARTAVLPRTPRTKEAGLAALEAGRQAALHMAVVHAGAAHAAPAQHFPPQTHVWEKAALATATSSAVTPPSFPPPPSLEHVGVAQRHCGALNVHSGPDDDEAKTSRDLPSHTHQAGFVACGHTNAQDEAADARRTVFDILPIGRRSLSPTGQATSAARTTLFIAAMGVLLKGGGERQSDAGEKKAYVSSDPLTHVKHVHMSPVLRCRLGKLLPDASAKSTVEVAHQWASASHIQAHCAHAPAAANSNSNAHMRSLSGADECAARRAPGDSLEVAGSGWHPVFVPSTSLSTSQSNCTSGVVAMQHSEACRGATKKEKRHKKARPLPLPRGGCLSSVGCADDTEHDYTAPHPPHWEPQSPGCDDNKDGNYAQESKALPSTPKDQSPLRSWGGHAWDQANDDDSYNVQGSRLRFPQLVHEKALELPVARQGLETQSSSDVHHMQTCLTECSTPPRSSAHRIHSEMNTSTLHSTILRSLDETAQTPESTLPAEIYQEALALNLGHACIVSERDLLGSLAPASQGSSTTCGEISDDVLTAVQKVQRTNPVLSRLDHVRLVAVLLGAQMHSLRLGDVETQHTSPPGPLSGISVLLSGSVRAEYEGSVSCGVEALGHSHLRHVLTPGDLMCGDEVVSGSALLRGGSALMPGRHPQKSTRY